MKSKIIIASSLILLFIITCSYDPISMPENNSSDIIFNTGEKRYIPVNPDWGGPGWDFDNPTDIYISQDDYIYVADSGNARIVVLSKTGEVVNSDDFGNDFSVLNSIPNVNNYPNPINPVAIGMDPKLNLYIVDNSDNIYVWNQYINNVRNSYPDGHDSIATKITYFNENTNDRIVLEPAQFYSSVLYEADGYQIEKVTFESNPSALDSIYQPHVFYSEPGTDASQFVSVAAAPFGDNQLYVADRIQQRIADLYVGRSSYIKLRNGVSLWQHRGYFLNNVATAGTGAGTVNDPTGMAVDESGNIYYTQLGENFSFHKITYSSSSGWVSSFALNINEIMDLDRFDRLFDVATNINGDIFVVDNGKKEVQVFDYNGDFVRNAGTRFVQTDTTIVDSVLIDGILTGVSIDTILTKEYSDVLESPKSVAVDDDIVYILDSGANLIRRYQLSTGLDIDLDNELGR